MNVLISTTSNNRRTDMGIVFIDVRRILIQSSRECHQIQPSGRMRSRSIRTKYPYSQLLAQHARQDLQMMHSRKAALIPCVLMLLGATIPFCDYLG
jgi:hypothetical protein